MFWWPIAVNGRRRPRSWGPRRRVRAADDDGDLQQVPHALLVHREALEPGAGRLEGPLELRREGVRRARSAPLRRDRSARTRASITSSISRRQGVRPRQHVRGADPALCVRRTRGTTCGSARHPHQRHGARPRTARRGASPSTLIAGASYGILFTVHPGIHFPTIKSTPSPSARAHPSSTCSPQLLQPHLRFSLALDDAVLQSPASA